MSELELTDIQGIVLRGYAHLPYASYLFLRFGDGADARAWLRGVVDEGEVTSAVTCQRDALPGQAVNVAFTPTGLRRLGLSDAALATFSSEFLDGMATPDRARILGDVGDSAPERWEVGWPSSAVDALLLLFAEDAPGRAALVERHRSAMAARGITLVTAEPFHSTPDPDNREHFGFRDGISQPAIEGGPPVQASPQGPVKPGEFILDHEDEYGLRPLPPSVSPAEDPGDRLLERDGRRLFGRNGSYLVFRKLSQDAAGFWRFVEEQTRRARGSADPEAMEGLAAKMVGRWQNGDPLVPSAGGPGTSLVPSNDFGYAARDAMGLHCPIAAHMRRANPRDSLPPDAAASLKTVARHRLIRRGRSYGPRIERPMSTVDDGAARGLFFVCLNARLRGQFEFVQQTWLNNPNFGDLDDDQDPLLGARDVRRDADGTAKAADGFTIPERPFHQRLSGLPRFVQMRGGGYFFLPGVQALRFLVRSGERAPAVAPGPATIASASPPVEPLHHLWSAVLGSGLAIGGDLENLRDLVLEHLQQWFSQTHVLRPLFAALREHRPILVAPGIAVVTRHDDVKEVLADHEAFRVTEVYAERMARTSGAFILGMEDTETFRREAGILRQAMRPGDLGAIREIVDGTAGALLRDAAPAGRIDLVGGLTRVVAARVVRDFFGVPGPDEATLVRWMRTIFWEIFLDPLDLPAVRAAAETSSREMLPYLDALIAERRRSPKDDFLGRLVGLQGDPATHLDDAGVRRNIGGLIVGAVDTTSKAASQIIAYLLDHPDELRGARRAARAGADDELAAYVFEALRFDPQAPLLLRHCGSTTTVARGTPRATEIPAGSLVVAATLSAGFDPDAVEDPERFRVDRPDRDLFHFGHGQHRCFGRMINHVQLPALVKQVLRLDGLRRAPGAEGVMVYDGPFPDRLIVEFDGLS